MQVYFHAVEIAVEANSAQDAFNKLCRVLEPFKFVAEMYSTQAGEEVKPVLELVQPKAKAEMFTLEGVERYLEQQDRAAFNAMRRANEAAFNNPRLKATVVQQMQDEWIAYGEAWGIIQKLVR